MSQLVAHNNHTADKSLFGLWVYLMTDCLLFAALFATFAVLRHGTFGGPGGSELFSPSFILTETIILLMSSFTIGLAVLASHRERRNQAVLWTAVTLLLGLLFISMELYEFREILFEGYSWRTSAFLSAFFTLVGTHGLHIIIGILWGVVLLVRMLRQDFGANLKRRLAMLGMFWHFLDIIWIFIFTFVYLLGVMG